MCTDEDCGLHSWKDCSGFHGVWYLGIELPHSSCSKMLRTQLGIQFQTECLSFCNEGFQKELQKGEQILRAPQNILGDALGWEMSITLLERTFRICREFMALIPQNSALTFIIHEGFDKNPARNSVPNRKWRPIALQWRIPHWIAEIAEIAEIRQILRGPQEEHCDLNYWKDHFGCSKFHGLWYLRFTLPHSFIMLKGFVRIHLRMQFQTESQDLSLFNEGCRNWIRETNKTNKTNREAPMSSEENIPKSKITYQMPAHVSSMQIEQQVGEFHTQATQEPNDELAIEWEQAHIESERDHERQGSNRCSHVQSNSHVLKHLDYTIHLGRLGIAPFPPRRSVLPIRSKSRHHVGWFFLCNICHVGLGLTLTPRSEQEFGGKKEEEEGRDVGGRSVIRISEEKVEHGSLSVRLA